MDIRKVVDFIIKETQEQSSGFQWVLEFNEVCKEFNIKAMNEIIIDKIVLELECREETASVEVWDSGFDVILYTDYVSNYR